MNCSIYKLINRNSQKIIIEFAPLNDTAGIPVYELKSVEEAAIYFFELTNKDYYTKEVRATFPKERFVKISYSANLLVDELILPLNEAEIVEFHKIFKEEYFKIL